MAQHRSFASDIRELWELLKDYARQETIDPLKGLGRYLAYGIGAAIATAIGAGLLLLGVLRLIQSEGGRFLDGRGDSSVAPYFAVVLLAALLAFLLASRIPKRFGDRP